MGDREPLFPVFPHVHQASIMSLPRRLAMGLLLSLPVFGAAAHAAPPETAPSAVMGTPLLQRFGPEDYNAAPVQLAAASDRRGRMLFGSLEGVLRYDGETWHLIDIPGHAAARSIARGEDGHVYVGSYDSFGWLVTDAYGRTRYQSLMKPSHLTGNRQHIGTVWSVLPTSSGVYFRSDRALHFIDYAHRHARNWTLPENARGFFVDGNALYTRYQGKGFGRFVDGVFHLAPGGRRFADAPLVAMLPMQGWRLLVGNDGFYRADAHGIRPMPGDAGQVLKGHQPYTATRLPDGGVAIGCRDGMLFQFSSGLRLRREVKLGHFAIRALASDHENGLWAATEGGLVRVAMPSPWSYLGGPQGVNGTVFDFSWYDHALWLAGSDGITRLTQHRQGTVARHMPWTTYEAYALLSTDQGLLIGHRDGLFVLDPGQDKPRILVGKNAGSVYKVQRSTHDRDLVYAVGEHDLFLIGLRQGRWQRLASIETGSLDAGDLIETAPGVVWVDNTRGGPQRLRIDTANGKLLQQTVYGAADGLDLDPHEGSLIYRLDGVLHAVSGDRGYRFNGRRFVADRSPPFSLVERPDELTIKDTALGTYAYTPRQLWHRPPGGKTWSKLNLNPSLAAGYTNLRLNRDGVLRISTWTGILQYDPRQHIPAPAPLKLYLNRLSTRPANGESKARLLPLDKRDARIRVPPGNTLTLHYSMVSMSGALFRYRLPGVMSNWSEWRDGAIFIRALRAGSHVLEVQARSRNGRSTVRRTFRFDTLPHWYQHWWAWLAGLAGLSALSALLTWAVVQRKTRRYRRANRELESRIAERTRELQAANRQLAEMATEDALTGVANRRALEQGMKREWIRCMDQRRALSVLMIDIDHFKQFNDRNGHLEGDQCLKAFAKYLHQQHNPRRELLARYGGEEFALLLPDQDLEHACRRAEALRISMAESDLGVTVSIGVAGYVPHPDLDPESLLRRADAALYRAKHSGRNRVEIDTE